MMFKFNENVAKFEASNTVNISKTLLPIISLSKIIKEVCLLFISLEMI